MLSFTRYSAETDGDIVFDGITTVAGITPSNGIYAITRPLSANRMTINSGVTVQMAVFGSGSNHVSCRILDIQTNGVLSWNGPNASGSTAGAGWSAAGSLNVGVSGGGTGSSGGAAGGTSNSSVTSMGGAGGAGGSAGGFAGGTLGTFTLITTAQMHLYRSWQYAATGRIVGPSSFISVNGGGGGSGGGAAAGGVGGGGGGGGSSGLLICGVLCNSGKISANGGNGANAVSGVSGGGGGGGGGTLLIWVDRVNTIGTIQANGGTGGSGLGGGLSGASGSAGNATVIITQNDN